LRFNPECEKDAAWLPVTHIRRRRRKKIPMADRQPLIRPGRANEIWSADFVFDRVASGRMIKCLVIVDDATHER
jgi:hypothetical protein